jgi:hypothetical protein
MDKILGVLGGVPQTKIRNDDDFADRLNYRYTTTILVLFAIVVSTKQYVGDPINCWVPAHFTGNHEEYTNNYCWIRNTYYLPFEDHIPQAHEHDKRHMITYYQWMPLILLVQALLFYIPIMLWRSMNSRSGIDVNNIVEAGETFQNTELAAQQKTTLSFMTKQMDRYLESQHEFRSGCTVSLKNLFSRTCFRCCGRRQGNYLVSLYIVTKLLFLTNVFVQLFTLNFFLGHDFHAYGIDVIQSLWNGDDWTASPRFPRVTMCDFLIRRLGNVQRYTVQCVLPINLFNEKIYLFVWFWLVLLAGLTFFTLMQWIVRFAIAKDRHRFISKNLKLMNKDVSGDANYKTRVNAFVRNYLKQDGVFVLRLVHINTNAITSTEFIAELWDNYCKTVAKEAIGTKGDDDIGKAV